MYDNVCRLSSRDGTIPESFMKTSRGVLSELLPLANGVRQQVLSISVGRPLYDRTGDNNSKVLLMAWYWYAISLNVGAMNVYLRSV